MATPTLSQLFTELTRDEVVASALSVASDLELPITAWESGSVGREIIVILCQLIATFSSGAGTTAAAAGLLDFASSDWLTLTSDQVYDTQRADATFGTASVTLANASGVGITVNVNDIRFFNSKTGATYINTTSGFLAPTGGILVVDVVAENSGSASNAAVGDIDELVTPLTGVTCTNTTPLVGTDAQTDASLITQSREAVARLSPNGPADAYNYFAKATLRGDGSNAGVTRTKTYQPVSQPGIVIVYLASDAGVVGVTDVALVQTNIISNVVPTGITTTAVSAVEHDVPVSATIYLANGTTATLSQIQQVVFDQLTQYFTTIPIGGIELTPGAGGFLFLDALISQIFLASDQIVQAVITNQADDIPLNPNEVPVFTSVLANFNVVPT